MTAAEINRGLFEFVLPNFFPGKPHSWEQAGPLIFVWVTGEKVETIRIFSPAENSNHLRLYVLPEIVRRHRWDLFQVEVDRSAGGNGTRVLLEDPAVLAAAALQVLRGEG